MSDINLFSLTLERGVWKICSIRKCISKMQHGYVLNISCAKISATVT